MTHRYNLTIGSKELVQHKVLICGDIGAITKVYTRKKTVFKDAAGAEYVWAAKEYRPVKRLDTGTALVEAEVTIIPKTTVTI